MIATGSTLARFTYNVCVGAAWCSLTGTSVYFTYFESLPPGCNGFENCGIELSSSIFGAAAVLALWILIGVGLILYRERGLLLAEKEAERRAALGRDR